MQPVDLTNLREMIDGDTELEQALFEEFYNAGGECLAALEASLTATDSEAWRRNAHIFKGIAFNLGANALGDLCKKGQEEYSAPDTEKMVLLASIKTSFAQVKDYLKSL